MKEEPALMVLWDRNAGARIVPEPPCIACHLNDGCPLDRAVDDDLYPTVVGPPFCAGIVCDRSVVADSLCLVQVIGIVA